MANGWREISNDTCLQACILCMCICEVMSIRRYILCIYIFVKENCRVYSFVYSRPWRRLRTKLTKFKLHTNNTHQPSVKVYMLCVHFVVTNSMWRLPHFRWYGVRRHIYLIKDWLSKNITTTTTMYHVHVCLLKRAVQSQYTVCPICTKFPILIWFPE